VYCCIFFYMFPSPSLTASSPEPPPKENQALETHISSTPLSPFHSDWWALRVKPKPGSCRVGNISSVLFLPSTGVLFAPSLPLPLLYLTLTPNVAFFHLLPQLASLPLSLECSLFLSLFNWLISFKFNCHLQPSVDLCFPSLESCSLSG